MSRDIDNIFHYDGGDLATYGRMVESLDASIGRVLHALEQKGLAENTIVIFTSDNGGERFSKTWPLTGQKTELLEGGIRVPAIVRWPAQIKAGQVSEQVAISMDWLPTLLAAAGGAPDPQYPSDGENLLPQLLGQAAQRSARCCGATRPMPSAPSAPATGNT
jgi:arylsulfatase A-like enzyme